MIEIFLVITAIIGSKVDPRGQNPLRLALTATCNRFHEHFPLKTLI